jgi:hypothetical protein
MKVRNLALAALAGGLTVAALAATPAPAEKKSTDAHPVAVPTPPPVPESRDASRGPGILDSSRDGEINGINQDITIKAGETHDGNVTCIRGHVIIDGHVNGDVTVVAGSLDLRGSVDGDVTGVVSRLELYDKSSVEGDLTNVGGTLSREGATVQGQVMNVPFGIGFPKWGHGWSPGWGSFAGLFFWWKLFAIFLFFVCALLLAALVPERIRLISEEAPARLFTAFIFGLVGYVVFAFAQIFLTLTIIGIPLVFLSYLVFVVLKWLAMCGVFHQIGSRVGRAMGREMSLLGAILLGLLPFAVLRLIPVPCVGFSIWFLVEILAFGYLILTRVGTRGTPAAAPLGPPMSPGTIAS